ncbi:hypothetical protein [Paenibacillus hamazuiensis]|uniref:hypothetical protein n=1 Tax=Paenibacillus hamazuiensis TaxID=2936508 RepID=UPI00200E4062|nr:hypothetical protein [Paenibacillus hamazuiensis]
MMCRRRLLRQWMQLWLRCAVAACSLSITAAAVGCSSSESGGGKLPLVADIGVTKQHLIVKNGDPFVWRQVTITLDEAFTYKTDIMPRGSSSIPLADFKDAGGESYRPGVTHLKRVRIEAAETEDGIPGQFDW